MKDQILVCDFVLSWPNTNDLSILITFLPLSSSSSSSSFFSSSSLSSSFLLFSLLILFFFLFLIFFCSLLPLFVSKPSYNVITASQSKDVHFFSSSILPYCIQCFFLVRQSVHYSKRRFFSSTCHTERHVKQPHTLKPVFILTCLDKNVVPVSLLLLSMGILFGETLTIIKLTTSLGLLSITHMYNIIKVFAFNLQNVITIDWCTLIDNM